MNGIPWLLIAGCGGLAIYFLVLLRKRVFDILFLFIMIIAIATLLLFPDLAEALSSKMKIGHQKELVFYLSSLVSWFVIVKLYQRIRSLEKNITQLIRKEAIKNSTTATTNKKNSQSK